MPKKELDLFQFAARRVAQPRADAPTVVRGQHRYSCVASGTLYHMPNHFLCYHGPQTESIRLTHRNNEPDFIAAPDVHTSIAAFTQSGTGTLRMCEPFPMRSAITQCPSLCCRCSSFKPAASALRKPHPNKTARMARSRRPRAVCKSGAWRTARLWSAVNQFPSTQH